MITVIISLIIFYYVYQIYLLMGHYPSCNDKNRGYPYV